MLLLYRGCVSAGGHIGSGQPITPPPPPSRLRYFSSAGWVRLQTGLQTGPAGAGRTQLACLLPPSFVPLCLFACFCLPLVVVSFIPSFLPFLFGLLLCLFACLFVCCATSTYSPSNLFASLLLISVSIGSTVQLTCAFPIQKIGPADRTSGLLPPTFGPWQASCTRPRV